MMLATQSPSPIQYEYLEWMILSEQISAREANDLLQADPKFKEWYSARARQRRGGVG